MIGAYAEILSDLAVVAARLGFSLERDEDFLARFDRSDGWAVVLSGDRVAYPAFSLCLARDESPGPERVYAVWLLMQQLDSQTPNARVRPSVENQLWFLETFADTLFHHGQAYRAGYLALERGYGES